MFSIFLQGINRAKRTLIHELEDTITPPGKHIQPNDKTHKKMSQVNFFGFESIAMATNNFSASNKHGEGSLDQL